VRDGDTTDEHRRQTGHWRQHAGASHLYVDALNDRGGLLGRELIRNCPARSTRRPPETLLKREVVQLKHDTVNVEGQGTALGHHDLEVCLHLFDTLYDRSIGAYL